MKIINNILKAGCPLALLAMLASCQKEGVVERTSFAPDHKINMPDEQVYDVVNTDHQVAYWSFNNNIKEQVGNRTATISKIDYGVDRKGFKSSSFSGNGKDIWFTVPADDKLKSGSVTVSLWVKPEVNTSGTGFLVSLTQKNTWANGYCLFMDAAATNYRFKATDFHEIKAGSLGNNWFDKSGGYPESSWFHLVYMWDANTSTQTVYVNGAEFSKSIASATAPHGPIIYSDGTANAEVMYVGKNGGTDSWIGPYKGLMDDLRVYDVALTPTEVAQIYNNEKVK